MSHTPHLSAIVEEQIKLWQGLHTKQEASSPIITVSREYGTSGSAISSKLAKKMNFSLWDQNLVNAIAESSGLSAQFLRALDEHARSTIEDLIAGLLMGREATEKAYISQLYRIVRTIENKGNGVIVGRGAQFIVDATKALRVRITAPFEQRTQWIAERHKLDPRAAEKKVRSIDKDREEFNKLYFYKDAKEPTYYDLTINVSTLPMDHAVEVIRTAYREKFAL